MLSIEERIKDLKALCDALERIHPSLEYKGVNIDLLRKEFEGRIKDTKDDEEFYNLLKELLDLIHDSHTRLVRVPKDFISHRWLENKIGYIRIQAFVGEEEKFIKRFDRALEDLKESRALVIDVRGNGGGSDMLADMVNGRFVKEPVISSIDFWREEGTDRYKKSIGLVMPRGPWTYEKPVAVLIDGGCASACEHFVSGAEATGRMLLVGTPTAGAGGGPTEVALPSGAVVLISRAIGIRACGVVFEGHGIPPHIEVRPDPEKIEAGIDVVLEEALKALEEWIEKGEIQLPKRFQPIDSRPRKYIPPSGPSCE